MIRTLKYAGLLSIIIITSCSNNNNFNISGTISNAKGSVLYLEIETLDGSKIEDSISIKSDVQKYKLKGSVSKYPEFFDLILDKEHINLIADSAMNVEVNIDAKKIYNYEVLNSASSLDLKSINNIIRNKKSILKTYKDSISSPLTDSVSKANIIERYNTCLQSVKDSLSYYIYKNPKSFVAYYAVFQRLFGIMIFDPLKTNDFRLLGAVATSFHTFLPDHKRTEHLYRYANEALNDRRNIEMKNAIKNLPVSIPEIALPNNKNDTVRLSSLKGSVTILYFWSYIDPDYKNNINQLETLFAKYESKGLKIYQVSIDNDFNEWQSRISSIQMPWINVCDTRGRNAECVGTYNLQKLPLLYLIDKKLNIFRGDSMTDQELDAKIKSLL